MADQRVFEYGEAIRAGWELTKKHWRLILAYIAVVIGLQMITSVFGGSGDEKTAFGAVVGLIVSLLVYTVSLAWCRMGIRLADQKTVQAKDLFWFDFPVLLSYLAGTVLYVLIIIGGLLLLIIPGIIFAVMFSQYVMLIADKKLGPIAALKESKRITSGQKWRLLVWELVQSLVIIGGLLLFFVGVVVAIPVVMMADFYVYTKLREAAGNTPALARQNE